MIRETQEGKEDPAVLWLDLSNVYGSIAHKLVETALKWHHIPAKSTYFILDCYHSFDPKVTSEAVTSEWHWLEKGIITGCTISVTLFALALNMLVK